MPYLVLGLLFVAFAVHAMYLWDTYIKANDIRFWILLTTKAIFFLLVINSFFPTIEFTNGQSAILYLMSLALIAAAAVPLHKVKRELQADLD